MTLNESRREQRHAQILDAAIRVFAQHGYHGCRISDIAAEAGIAYGLVYHYFQNKEAVLLCIFEEKWAIFLEVLNTLADDPDMSLQEKLAGVVRFMIALYHKNQDLAEVILMELIYSKHFRNPEVLDQFDWALKTIHKIFREGRERGTLAQDCNEQLLSLLFLGSLETIFTGFALQVIPTKDNDLERIALDTAALYSGGISASVVPQESN